MIFKGPFELKQFYDCVIVFLNLVKNFYKVYPLKCIFLYTTRCNTFFSITICCGFASTSNKEPRSYSLTPSPSPVGWDGESV